MDEGKEPKKLKARVGDKILKNVNAYFTNELSGIVTEMLQNARRAGASSVDVVLDRKAGRVQLRDNGRGLAAADAGILLTFGGSSNDDVIEHDESPAGMGFFSLARRGAKVRSRDWCLTIPPDVFTGDADAELETGLDDQPGLEVTFGGVATAMDGDYRAVVATIEAAAAPMPFTTTIDGRSVRRGHPMDWLRTAAGQPLFSDIIDRRVGDCLVTVARFEDGMSRLRQGRSDDSMSLTEAPWLYLRFDLFGQIIKLDDILLESLRPELGLRPEKPIAIIEGNKAPRFVTPSYFILVEALGSQTLTPRLPDRRELVVTKGLHDVLAATLDLMASLAARAARNGVEATSALRRHAEAEGIAIPSPQAIALRLPAAGAGVLQDLQLATRAAHLAIVAENGGITLDARPAPERAPLLLVKPSRLIEVLVARSPLREDAVISDARIAGLDDVVSIDILFDGTRLPIWESGQSSDDALDDYAPARNAIEVIRVSGLQLESATRGGRQATVRLAHAIVGAETMGGRVRTFVADGAPINDIVEDLEGATFHYDEKDEDGEDTQRSRFRQSMRRQLLEATGSPAQVIADAITTAIVDAEAWTDDRIRSLKMTRVGDERRIHVVLKGGSRGDALIAGTPRKRRG